MVAVFFTNEGLDFNYFHVDLRGLGDLKGRAQPLLFFLNSEGLRLHPIDLDLRGLGDLKGWSTFAVFF
jgi:hypothetical protein